MLGDCQYNSKVYFVYENHKNHQRSAFISSAGGIRTISTQALTSIILILSLVALHSTCIKKLACCYLFLSVLLAW